MAKKEEIFSHFFNFTFSVAPDALLEKLFCAAVRVSDAGPFDFLGLTEIAEESTWQGKNVGQHDALIVSDRTAIAMELKTGSPSSPSQLVKYLALIVRLLKERPHIRMLELLFICPAGHRKKFSKVAASPRLSVPPDFLDRHLQSVNADVQAVFASCPDETTRVLEELIIAVMTWSEVHLKLCDVRRRLKSADAYQQTLGRLLEGFIQQLEAQERTGIPREQIETAQPLFSGNYGDSTLNPPF